MLSPMIDIPRTSIWHRMSHGCFQEIDVAFTVYSALNTVESEDLRFAGRLLSALRKALAYEEARVPKEQLPNSGVWAQAKEQKHAEFYRLAAAQDVEAFARHLSNALRHDVCFGLGPGPATSKIICTPGPERNELLLGIFDNLVSCAEALGALRVETAELDCYGEHLTRPIEDVVVAIETCLGYRIGRPKFMGVTGIEVGDRVIDNRLADDIYCASRITSLGRAFSKSRICEIGGGFGGLAHQTRMAGCDRYTIADLPIINVIQAFFLMKACGPSCVSLFGEGGDAAVDIIPYWEFYDRDFDFVVNRDSMAEMPLEVARGYLKRIGRSSAAFLSVNQESTAPTGDGFRQLNVSALAGERLDLTRIARHRYWTRPGYVEEFYLPTERPFPGNSALSSVLKIVRRTAKRTLERRSRGWPMRSRPPHSQTPSGPDIHV